MSCAQNNYDPLTGNSSTENVPAGTISAAGGPYLIVCDAPERIPQELNRSALPLLSGPESAASASAARAAGGDYDTYTLYKCDITLTSGTKRIRVYFWHESHLSSASHLVFAAKVSSGTATLSNATKQVASQIADGLCVAKAQMYQTPDTATLDNSLINTAEKAFFSVPLPSGAFRGGFLEFDVTVSSSKTWQFRFLVSSTSGLSGSWSDAVAWPRQEALDQNNNVAVVMHSRGWWPYSTITMPAGTVEVKPVHGQPDTETVTVYPTGSTRLR